MINAQVRILVIDDSGEARLILLRHLKRLGFSELAYASDGAEGVAKAESWNPHLVFVDGIMPAMGGLEALEAIKHHAPQTVVVVCSSLSDRETVMQFQAAGADGYLLKPYDRIELESVLDGVLPRVRPSAEVTHA